MLVRVDITARVTNIVELEDEDIEGLEEQEILELAEEKAWTLENIVDDDTDYEEIRWSEVVREDLAYYGLEE